MASMSNHSQNSGNTKPAKPTLGTLLGALCGYVLRPFGRFAVRRQIKRRLRNIARHRG